MKVLYDITTLAHIHCAEGVHGAGIFRHVEETAVALARHDDLHFDVSVAATQLPKAIRYLSETDELGLGRLAVPTQGAKGVGPVLATTARPSVRDGRMAHRLIDRLSDSYTPARVYNGGQYDIFHLNWRGDSRLPDHSYPATVVTVPDVIALKHPEWFVEQGARNEIGDYLTTLLESVGAAHGVITSTEAVKADIVDLFANISADQVHVVPLGVSERFHRRDDEEIAAVRSRYGVPDDRRYVLCVNTLEPRKNMSTVVDAYAALVRDPAHRDVCLVMAGAKGWLSDDLLARVDADGEGSIVLTGYVDDQDMAALYSGASVFAYPSFDEGFGLPVLEAMRCGVPVVTSDRPALRESGGDAVIAVDPNDAAGLTAALADVLSDEARASQLARAGMARAETFTWDRSADQIVAAYRQVADRRSAPSSTARATSLHQSLADLKGRFAGQRAFILGDEFDPSSGPSAALADEHTIAVNGFATAYEWSSWKPTCYVVTDGGRNEQVERAVNGLTGSMFFFGEDDHLRVGPDVIPVRQDADGVVAGIDLVEPGTAPVGPDRSLSAAIQIAYHLGFDPVYLIEPELDEHWRRTALPGPSDGRRHRRAWHDEHRRAIEAAGRQLVNLTPGVLPGVHRRDELHRVIAANELPEYPRSAGAHLDETHIIASLIPDPAGQPRVMVDVGAHRGTSARPFLELGWRVYCFEPDPDNRWHLERRLSSFDRLTIDTRAVGAEPGARIPFYRSDESSGISGLSPFRDSHEVQGYVEVTDVASIVDEYAITALDFLKIDVEGFDFSVLQGVPWDRIRPAVIECEYEDAKTLPMGHSMLDMAEFLRSKGYAVYVSEWHPIIRYGIEHQWRRVVPYPGIDVPSNSWGNLLAFLDDPGYAAVQRAFAADLTLAGGPEVATAPVAPTAPPRRVAAVTEPTSTEPQAPKRHSYADAADRLRSKSPGVYRALRLVRRTADRALRSPGQLLVALVAVAAVVIAGALAEGETRLLIWGAGVAIALGLCLLAVAVYANKTAVRLSEHARAQAVAKREIGSRLVGMDGRISAAQRSGERIDAILADVEALRSLTGQLDGRVAETEVQLRAAAGSVKELEQLVDRQVTSVEQAVAALRKDLAAGDLPIDRRLEQVQAAAGVDRRFSNYANAPRLRLHERWLGAEDVQRIREHWLRQLGLSLTDREIYYMAHKICLDEDRCEGRMATTIQAAMLRSLALLSLRSPRIELLEIGTLFGLAAGTLHRIGGRANCEVVLTLIDPLTGYYGVAAKDGQTGVSVTRESLVHNLRELGVPDDQYRIVQALSTDEEAVRETSDRLYDYVLIDGDHSLQGVSDDYQLYKDLVRPGGLLIFDDYDTDDWPAIKPFVDEHVRSDDDWLWIGGEWRTAILQRKRLAEHSDVGPT